MKLIAWYLPTHVPELQRSKLAIDGERVRSQSPSRHGFICHIQLLLCKPIFEVADFTVRRCVLHLDGESSRFSPENLRLGAPW